jgi:glycosyltransferase involved in cell wall biosynthesis
MRIAQVAPLYESVPPKLYGGTERVVSWLTEELVALGHDVTLFASGDSVTSARLVPACERALWRDPACRETLPQHVHLIEVVFRRAAEFDALHFHSDYIHLPLLRYCSTPTVTTLHGCIRPHDVSDLFTDCTAPLVSISNDQRRPLPRANWAATVYHGLPRHLHTFRHGDGGYLAFIGRISPDKRLDRAIEIAQRSGRKLKVAAKIYDEDRDYFHEKIEPLMQVSRSFVDFIGEVGGSEKDEFLGSAAGLVFPIDWPEPFGLVMIEALACGTPVIAWRNGSVPEVVEHGKTGFVVESIPEAVEAVRMLGSIDRSGCRDTFETRFDSTRMARDYVRVYERLIDGCHTAEFVTSCALVA